MRERKLSAIGQLTPARRNFTKQAFRDCRLTVTSMSPLPAKQSNSQSQNSHVQSCF